MTSETMNDIIDCLCLLLYVTWVHVYERRVKLANDAVYYYHIITAQQQHSRQTTSQLETEY
jgi:hypothetical protein